MISNIDELQAFILWCKDNKIKHMKLNGIEFEVSELAFIPETELEATKTNLNPQNTETLTDTLKDQDVNLDPDLFWSSQT